MKRMGFCFPVLCGLLLFGFEAASAQTIFMTSIPDGKPKFSFRFIHPDYKGDYGPTMFSGEYALAASVPINEVINLTASMPIFHQKYKYRLTDESGYEVGEATFSENSFGNLYLGVQTRQALTNLIRGSASFGVYLPTAEYEFETFVAYGINVATNPYEMRGIIPKTLVIYGNYAIHMQTPAPVSPLLGLEVGPEIYLPTDNRVSRDTEVLFHYGVLLGLTASHMALQGELLGLYLASEGGVDFTDRFDHFAAFGVQAANMPVCPGVFCQIPLDEEYRYFMNAVLGVKIDVSLP